MNDLIDAFAQGYDDAEQHGENLNPYTNTDEWEAYEEGYLEYINEQLAEAAKIQRESEFGA